MRLSPLTYLGFAAPGFFMALTAIPTYITLQKFYVDEIGIAAATVGLVLVLSRILDAFTDPLIGWMSDRTSGRLGRRKPYMLLGGALCAISLWPLLQPNNEVTAAYLFTWISIFYFGAALIQVPYAAWTADLTKDYATRTRLSGYGQLALLLGTVIALGAPQAVEGVEQQLYILAIISLVAIPVTIGPAVFLVREQKAVTPPSGGPFDALLLPFNQPRLRRFAIAYGLNALGNTLPLTLTLFYFDHVLDEDPSAPLLLYFLAAMAFIPIWTYLGNKIGRGVAWQRAILISTLAQFPMFLLGPETTNLFYISALITGACLSAEFTLPQAMQADLADEDTASSGKDRAATHYAFWSVSINITTALGAGLALSLIGWAGFIPGASVGESANVQPKSAVWAIAIGYACLPALFKMPAWLILANFEKPQSACDTNA